jgi:hypothetical protein
MKIFLSISLTLLLLFSGINIHYAAHYCGGTLVATKISLSSELATCGMENTSYNNSAELLFKNHCCDDVTTCYSICNKYLSSSFDLKEPGQKVISLTLIPMDFLRNQEIITSDSSTDIKPPGTNYPNSFARPALCIFRI